MLTVSGALIRHIQNPRNTFSPVYRVEYYDTPLSVESWGFKHLLYEADEPVAGEFNDHELVFSGRDGILSHSWGETGPEHIRGSVGFQSRWLGYFYANYTGTYKFYISCDDGARFYIGLGSSRTLVPSGLGSNELLDVNSTLDNVTTDSWAQRNEIATYSGWCSLSENTWYPIKVDYFNEAEGLSSHADILVRYQEPDDVTNSNGETSDTSERKVLGAGIVNYPFGSQIWTNADDARFIGTTTSGYYTALRDIIEITGERKLGVISQYEIKLPLAPDKYKPLKGRKGHFTYGTDSTIIRPGRLVDIYTGFQTQCRFYHPEHLLVSGLTQNSSETSHVNSVYSAAWHHQTLGKGFDPNNNSQPPCDFKIDSNQKTRLMIVSGITPNYIWNLNKYPEFYDWKDYDRAFAGSVGVSSPVAIDALSCVLNSGGKIHGFWREIIATEQGIHYYYEDETGNWNNSLEDTYSSSNQPQADVVNISRATIFNSYNGEINYIYVVLGASIAPKLVRLSGPAGGSISRTTIKTYSSSSETVENAAAVCDPDTGNIHVIVTEELTTDSNEKLRYYKYTEDTSTWSSGEVVYDFNGSAHNGYNAIDIDSDGILHITTHKEGSSEYKLMYIKGNAGNWISQEVSSPESDGGHKPQVNIKVDINDNPHITWRRDSDLADTINKNLMYARFDGADWHIDYADYDFNTGFVGPMQLDHFGNVHVIHGNKIGTGLIEDIRYSTNAPGCGKQVKQLNYGGYFSPNFCSTVNQKCPYQKAMPGDNTQRIRGRITDFKIERDRDQSFLTLVCQDNLYYLKTAINENYPNNVSYAMFDYESRPATYNHPDGVGKPTAYDTFIMRNAIMDMCVKSGIDPKYLYGKENLIVSGADSSLEYVTGSRIIHAGNVRLPRNAKYGNPLYPGLDNDPNADDEYVWKQGFGDYLIDHVSSMTENYGFMLGCREDGQIMVKTRKNNIFFAPSGLAYPSNWHLIPDPRCVTGSYIYASGNQGHARINVRSSEFNVYFGTQGKTDVGAWSVLFNQGIIVPWFEHAQYNLNEVESFNELVGPVLNVGGAPAYVIVWNEPQIYMVKEGAAWITLDPMYDFTFEKIKFKSIGADLSSDTTGMWYTTREIKADVHIGQYTVTADSQQQIHKQNALIEWNGSPTQIASNIDIEDLFISLPEPVWHELDVTPTAVASGTSYAIKITPKLYIDGSHYNQTQHIARLAADPVFKSFCINSYPWTYELYFEGVKIDANATPSPLDWRIFYSLYDRFSGEVYFNLPDWYINYQLNEPRTFVNFTIAGVDAEDSIHSNPIGIEIWDQDRRLYQAQYRDIFPTPYDESWRFSSDGIDPYLGYNPNIWEINGQFFVNYLEEFGIYPNGNEYIILVSGKQLRLEAIATTTDNILPKFTYKSDSNIFDFDLECSTDDIRNDIIVVGRLQGYVTEPDTESVINPNNPTLDYVYSRAIDIGSKYYWDAENSMGISVPFLIYEPGIKNQAHADYLSFAVLDRQRKVQNKIDWNALPAIYLELEDSIFLHDSTQYTNVKNHTQWIEGISESITKDGYNMNFESTPLEPWQSYIKKEPPYLGYWLDEWGRAMPIINVEMTDEYGDCRNPGATGGGTSYDPYESEGASANSDSGAGYPVNKLQVKFTLLVNGWIRACVKTTVLDNDQHSGDHIVAWLIGGETKEKTPIRERYDWGTYILIWDGIDVFGESRTDQQAHDEGIQTDKEGIYARDSRYYVEWEVYSDNESDHTVLGAPHDKIWTQRLSNSINPANATLGEDMGWSSAKAQFWKLAIGNVATVTINHNNTWGNLSPIPLPRAGTGTSVKLMYCPNTGESTDLYLASTGAAYFQNRGVKYEIEIREGSLTIFPEEEWYQHYYSGSWYPKIVPPSSQYLAITPGEHLNWQPLPSFSFAGDAGITISQHGSEGPYTNDEFRFYKPIVCQNSNWGTIPGVPNLNKTDNFRKMNDSDMRISFNPMEYGIYYNQIPKNKFGPIRDQIWEKEVSGYDPIGNPYRYSIGFKIHQVCFITRWFNFYFNVFDKSGRSVDHANTWSHHAPYGKITDVNHERYGWLGYRLVWVPLGQGDCIPANLFDTGPDAENQLESADVNNETVRRLNINSYTDQNFIDSDGNIVELHTLLVMHHENPNAHLSYLGQISTLSEWRQHFSAHMWYAFPFWSFWDINPGANNYTWRTVAGDGVYWNNPPQEETFR